MKAGFYGPFIQAHDRSDFLGAEAFHIPQHQDHSVLWRQRLDGLIENAAQFFILKGFLWAEAIDRNLKFELAVGCRDKLFK